VTWGWISETNTVKDTVGKVKLGGKLGKVRCNV
jgi:hypothetical protein